MSNSTPCGGLYTPGTRAKSSARGPSVSARGRIVSTKETSLVGVGVLVEGMRDTVVVHRMIDSSFHDARHAAVVFAGGQTIGRETVRPDRPVQVRAGREGPQATRRPPDGDVRHARASSVCPRQARSFARRGLPQTSGRSPFSMRGTRGRSASTRSCSNGGARSRCFVAPKATRHEPTWSSCGRSILYRRFEPGGIRADSSRSQQRTRRARPSARLGGGACDGAAGSGTRSRRPDANAERGETIS